MLNSLTLFSQQNILINIYSKLPFNELLAKRLLGSHQRMYADIVLFSRNHTEEATFRTCLLRRWSIELRNSSNTLFTGDLQKIFCEKLLASVESATYDPEYQLLGLTVLGMINGNYYPFKREEFNVLISQASSPSHEQHRDALSYLLNSIGRLDEAMINEMFLLSIVEPCELHSSKFLKAIGPRLTTEQLTILFKKLCDIMAFTTEAINSRLLEALRLIVNKEELLCLRSLIIKRVELYDDVECASSTFGIFTSRLDDGYETSKLILNAFIKKIKSSNSETCIKLLKCLEQMLDNIDMNLFLEMQQYPLGPHRDNVFQYSTYAVTEWLNSIIGEECDGQNILIPITDLLSSRDINIQRVCCDFLTKIVPKLNNTNQAWVINNAINKLSSWNPYSILFTHQFLTANSRMLNIKESQLIFKYSIRMMSFGNDFYRDMETRLRNFGINLLNRIDNFYRKLALDTMSSVVYRLSKAEILEHLSLLMECLVSEHLTIRNSAQALLSKITSQCTPEEFNHISDEINQIANQDINVTLGKIGYFVSIAHSLGVNKLQILIDDCFNILLNHAPGYDEEIAAYLQSLLLVCSEPTCIELTPLFISKLNEGGSSVRIIALQSIHTIARKLTNKNRQIYTIVLSNLDEVSQEIVCLNFKILEQLLSMEDIDEIKQLIPLIIEKLTHRAYQFNEWSAAIKVLMSIIDILSPEVLEQLVILISQKERDALTSEERLFTKRCLITVINRLEDVPASFWKLIETNLLSPNENIREEYFQINSALIVSGKGNRAHVFANETSSARVLFLRGIDQIYSGIIQEKSMLVTSPNINC